MTQELYLAPAVGSHQLQCQHHSTTYDISYVPWAESVTCVCVQAHQQQQYGLMQDCQAHMAVVEAQAGAVFGACFQLLARVSEVDSMVRVLHLVTVMLEALGPKAQPHFAAITAALPQVCFLT